MDVRLMAAAVGQLSNAHWEVTARRHAKSTIWRTLVATEQDMQHSHISSRFESRSPLLTTSKTLSCRSSLKLFSSYCRACLLDIVYTNSVYSNMKSNEFCGLWAAAALFTETWQQAQRQG